MEPIINTQLAEEALSLEQQEIIDGLLAEQKYINPKFFYDKKGSELFEKITQLDEYYPTRTERIILQQYANEMTNYIPQSSVLIEPGAGACEKVKLILDALKPKAYLPQDVSEVFLQRAAQQLNKEFQWLAIDPIVSDFAKPLEIPGKYQKEQLFVFYPGSTIGNFEPDNAKIFLRNMRELVGKQGGVLLGADLQKNTSVIEAAYNDAQGVTAEFNLNMLTHINRILNSDFDVDSFAHKAFYNQELNRIEMHLISKVAQSYDVSGHEISFHQDETIHTENSYKFSLNCIRELAQETGFELKQTWMDTEKLFSLNFFQAV